MRVAMSLLLALVAGLSVSCSSTDRSNPSAGAKESDTDGAAAVTGQTWLKWDGPSRLAFIKGNLRGYWDGQAAGCGEAKIIAMSLPGVTGMTEDASEQMRFRCANKLKLSNRSFHSYEQVVTAFYSRYSDLQEIEAQDLLQLLIFDPEAKLTEKDLRERISTGR